MLRALVILLILFNASATLAKEGAPIQSGDWLGNIYTSDETGKFSHCLVGGDYKSGISLLISVNRLFVLTLGFYNEDWSYQQEVRSLMYRFDSDRWRTSDARTLIDGRSFAIDVPGDSEVVTLFRQSNVLEIFFLGKNYKFNLVGTSRVTADLADCVSSQLALETKPSLPPTENNSVSQTTVTPPAKNPEAKPSSGSGILISDKGHVLTNFHVVEGCRTFTVVPSGALASEAKLLTMDEANDLAVLKLTSALDSVAFAKFRGGRGVKAGEPISVFGYPLVGTLSTSGNFVTGSISSLAGMGDDARMMQISAPVQPGNSGGPLLDSSGSVIGVVNSKLNEIAYAKATGSLPQNVNFAIKANVAMNFLDAHSVPYELEADAQTIEPSGVADKARQFTVLVNCNFN
jgi:S1-C subfamily serine protease